MSGFSLKLPFSVWYDSGKQVKEFRLNLNIYRNTHFAILNKAKASFRDLVWFEFPPVKYEKIQLDYKLFLPTKREIDCMNVITIVDKFLCDAMVEKGIIPDDNMNHIPFLPTGGYGGVDKENPRIEVKIIPLS